MKALEAGKRVKGYFPYLVLGQLLYVHAAVMGDGHHGGAEEGRIRYGEVYFVLCRNSSLEGHSVGLYRGVPERMLDEVKPLLFLEGGRDVLRPAYEAGLALLAYAALEDRLYKHLAASLDEVFYIVHARFRPEDLGVGVLDPPQELIAPVKACKLHKNLRLDLTVKWNNRWRARKARQTFIRSRPLSS